VGVDRDREILSRLVFDDRGLIPAIVQDENGQVLMLAYMNREALARTLAEGRTWFYSRSRGRLWLKGETSGHYQHVQAMSYDCDADALLLRVRQEGVACHEGYYSCFHHQLVPAGEGSPAATAPAGKRGSAPGVAGPGDAGDGGAARAALGPGEGKLARALAELAAVIAARREAWPEGSYTAYLLQHGVDKIGKKVGEEAAEVIIAAKNASQEEITREAADLFYHLLVLLAATGVSPEQVGEELLRRRR
jgi:phosphoribosyl-ATP pyrophosphohydrolase/phosphoribosyl-AMP cyclohydrolase